MTQTDRTTMMKGHVKAHLSGSQRWMDDEDRSTARDFRISAMLNVNNAVVFLPLGLMHGRHIFTVRAHAQPSYSHRLGACNAPLQRQ